MFPASVSFWRRARAFPCLSSNDDYAATGEIICKGQVPASSC
jgi:hypothetical protein